MPAETTSSAMSWRSIPQVIPRWLQRHPLALTAVIRWVNRIRGSGRRWSVSIFVAIAVLAPLLVAFVASSEWAGFAIRKALEYAAVVAIVSGLYAASLVSGRRRALETVWAQSWLVATLPASAGWMQTLLLAVLPLVWRTTAAVTIVVGLSLGSSINVEQSVQLGALIAIGAAAGVPCGWWLSRRPAGPERPVSRYTPRRKSAASIAPSSDALSHWPIAHALASGRPENARLVLAAAILTVPGGIGILAALLILGTWALGYYLIGLLVATPRVGRLAIEWLRSTPITFWNFAWPLVRRALLHQVIGTFAAMGAGMSLSASLSTALYLGAVWLGLVVLTWTIGLADAYRARAFSTKTAISALAALLAEARVHGLGIAIAVFVAILHIHLGARHERA